MRAVREALGLWSARDEVAEVMHHAKKVSEIPINLGDIDKEIAYMDDRRRHFLRFERALQHCVDEQRGCIHTTEELYDLASKVAPGFENTGEVDYLMHVIIPL